MSFTYETHPEPKQDPTPMVLGARIQCHYQWMIDLEEDVKIELIELEKKNEKAPDDQDIKEDLLSATARHRLLEAMSDHYHMIFEDILECRTN